MPSFNIPLIAPVNQNVDPIALEVFAAEIRDGYIDDAGYLVRRAGRQLFSDIGVTGEITGLYFWEERGALIVVSEGLVYRVDRDGSSTSIGTGLTYSGTPTFAAFVQQGKQQLAIANGGSLLITDGDTSQLVTDLDLPERVSHVVHFDGFLVVNNLITGRFHYSEILDAFSWSALDFQSAESKPDPVVAMNTIGGILYAFGTRSVEAFYNEGGDAFERNRTAEVQGGILAPHSLAQIQSSLFYVDDFKRVVLLAGNGSSVISNPIGRKLEEVQDLEKSVGSVLIIGGQSFYVLRTPSRTFVYDVLHNMWHDWGHWNSFTSDYDNFDSKMITVSRAWGTAFCGGPLGKVYEMNTSYYTDEGRPMRTMIRSGYLSHGSPNLKISNRLAFRLKRGVASTSNAPDVTLRYRDEDEGAFSNEETISLGSAGESDFYVTFQANGQYRARQYELSCASDAQFIIGGIQEDVTEMVS